MRLQLRSLAKKVNQKQKVLGIFREYIRQQSKLSLQHLLLLDLLIEEVEGTAKERADQDGRDPSEVMVLQQDCHHHLRNVWFSAITKRLSAYLNDLLAADLDAINFRYRVSTKINAVLRAIDKEFSLPANYPKGHGDHFKHWLKREHTGALLVPV